MDRNYKFKTVITAEHKLFDLHIDELFQYRDLIFLFVKRDFISKYKQTILGPAWAIIQPLLTTIVFTIVFGNLAGLTTTDIAGNFSVPSFLFYMTGNICWTFFSGTLQATSSTFITNSNIMGKVYYPRMVTPISTVFSNLISFGIQFVMLVVFWTFYLVKGDTTIVVTGQLILIPFVVLEMSILALGFGMIISSVTTKYRDLQMLVGFGLQLWQYACPIAYGLALIPQKFLPIYLLNPMTSVITTFRYAMFGFGYFSISYYLLGWGISLVVFFVGMILFSKVERTFMDTI